MTGWLGWLALGPWAWAHTERYALVVGANDGGEGRVMLRYAVQDARSFGDVLVELGGVPDSHRTLLTEPTRDGFADALGALRQVVSEADARGLRTEVVVYYSGHSDETGLQLGTTTYPYLDLREDLEAIGADVQVVVLDSCASGALVRAKGGVMRKGFLEDASNDVRGTAYLMSATADEAAQESDAIGGSFFTHYLVSGLRGGADHTQDGRVTLHEAYEYAKGETLRRTERTSIGPQHATHSTKLGGHGDFVFTDLTATPSSLVFDPGITGRLFVRGEAGHLLAELATPGDRAVELALAPGTYTVVREDGGQRWEAVLALGDAEHLAVRSVDFVGFTGERVVARGAGAPADASPTLRTPIAVLARGDRVGTQVGLVGAEANRVRGLQLAAVFTRAHGGGGMQGALALNQGTDFSGFQGAFLMNVADGASAGFQHAYGLNVAADRFQGAQLAAVNVAEQIEGVQLGVVNQAAAARGLQLGLVNAGGDGAGLQLGLVNLGRDYDGAALGLVTVHRRGYNHLFASLGTQDLATLGATWGSRYVYTTAQLGVDRARAPSGVLGLGGHLPLGRTEELEDGQRRERGLYVDLDLGVGYRVGQRAGTGDLAHGALGRLRVQPGFNLGRRLALQTGVTVENALGRPDPQADPTVERYAVGWTVGLRI